jgi:hypothetical protein
MRTGLAAFALLTLAGTAPAADTGELWDVSTVMNMPGMPAGMGTQKSQVCRDKDAPPGPPRNDCTITNRKRSGLTESMTVSCPRQGEMHVEMTYNAARTEYKGTMKSGDMVINTSGRKVGACDPQVARAEQDQKVGKMKAQAEQAQAQGQAAIKQMNEQQVASCAAAVQTMDARKLGQYGVCEQSNSCDTYLKAETTRPAAVKCMANKDEYCRRFQTPDGFVKAGGDEQGAKMCKVSAEQLKVSLCPRAAKEEHLGFLGRYCPAEAKPIATAHCVGRDYTSKVKDRYSDFCMAYISRNGSMASPSKPESTTDKVNDAAQQGINKLKGLFGR